MLPKQFSNAIQNETQFSNINLFIYWVIIANGSKRNMRLFP
jgi:hypothetical protein